MCTGSPIAPGRADRDPAGEPRSDATADISALLVPQPGKEPRSGALLIRLGEPESGRAPALLDDLHHVAEPTSRQDPRLAPDPNLDPFVANLLGPACPAGALPFHSTRNLFTCALVPVVTLPDDTYLSSACVVCVMIGAGLRGSDWAPATAAGATSAGARAH